MNELGGYLIISYHLNHTGTMNDGCVGVTIGTKLYICLKDSSALSGETKVLYHWTSDVSNNSPDNSVF